VARGLGDVSEFRRDPISGAWVIVAPERNRRPQPSRRKGAGSPAPRFDPDCPFCPGNEAMLPTIIEESAGDAPPGWLTRVVTNKYPALSPDDGPPAAMEQAGLRMSGYGFHEVIIETARHDGDLSTLDAPGLDAIVHTYHRRFADLAGRTGIRAVVVFRNHGRRGGASLTHPHAQAIATALMPPRLADVVERAHAYHARNGQCLMCAELALELSLARRIVEVSKDFVVLVPYAAAAPCEMWIVPRRHQASFAEAHDGELVELARVLQRTLRRLNTVIGDAPYNFAIESVATPGADSQHWRLCIMPRIAEPGGFELGSGLAINPSSPEDDAEALRLAPA